MLQSAFFPPASPSQGAGGTGLYDKQQQQPAGGGGAAAGERPRTSGGVGGAAAAPLLVSAYAASGGRGTRFPSSRRYLWDRTPAGAQVLVSTQDLVPRTSISASALAVVAEALSRGGRGSGGAGVQLQLSLAATSTFQLTALLQAVDPLAEVDRQQAGAGPAAPAHGANTVRVACALVEPGPSPAGGGGAAAAAQAALHDAGGGDSALAAALAAKMDATQGPPCIAEMFALSVCAVPATEERAAPSLVGRLLLPGCGLLLTPLFTKRLCPSRLSEALLRPGRLAPGSGGYLTMDQARSLLPLSADDESAHTTPLVGVWVKGPDSPLHPLVAAACLRFYYASTLLDRALSEDGAFLLLLCPEGQPVSYCYEVRTTEPGCLPLASYSLEVELEPARQLARHPSGLIPLGWAADAAPPAPLALPPHRPAASPASNISGQAGALVRPASPEQAAALSWRIGATAGVAGGSGVALEPARPGPRYGQPGLRGSASPVAAACALKMQAHATAAPGGPAIDDSEPQPRPSPRGLRPYGSPGLSEARSAAASLAAHPSQALGVEAPWQGGFSAGQGMQQQQQQQQQQHSHQHWAADEESEDGGRADGVRLGSPVRVERADAGAGAARGSPPHIAPGSPSLPVLLGSPYSPSPRHVASGVLAGGVFSPATAPRDVLRDSLDSGRRGISAAATAIASAEAAVLRGGAGGPAAGRASNGSPGAMSGDDPLRWSLRQSAQAVGGLAAALDAAASALVAPGADAPLAPALPASSVQQLQPAGAAAGTWAGGDPETRALQEEVVRLRTELARLQQLLADATRLPPPEGEDLAGGGGHVGVGPHTLGAAAASQPRQQGLQQSCEQPSHDHQPPPPEQQQQRRRHQQQQQQWEQEEEQQQQQQQQQHWRQPQQQAEPKQQGAQSPGKRSRLSRSSAGAEDAGPSGLVTVAPHSADDCAGAAPAAQLAQQPAVGAPLAPPAGLPAVALQLAAPRRDRARGQPGSPASAAGACSPQHPAMVAVARGSPATTAEAAHASMPAAGAAHPLDAASAAAPPQPATPQAAAAAAATAATSAAAPVPAPSAAAAPAGVGASPDPRDGQPLGSIAACGPGTATRERPPAAQDGGLDSSSSGSGGGSSGGSGGGGGKGGGDAGASGRGSGRGVGTASSGGKDSSGGGSSPSHHPQEGRRGPARAADSPSSSGGLGSAGSADSGADSIGPVEVPAPASSSVTGALATVAALFPGQAALSPRAGAAAASPSSATGGQASPGRPGTAAPAAVRSSYSMARSSIARSSTAFGPVGPVVRTQYTPLSGDEDDEEDDDELEARLMRKYGLAA